MTAPFVTLSGISKSFVGVKVLKDVSFDVRPGEVHALLGENGAGKSTLIKILSGLYTPDAGTITLPGAPVTIPANAHFFWPVNLDLSAGGTLAWATAGRLGTTGTLTLAGNGDYTFTPAVVGDAVYAASAKGTLSRIEDGKTVWKIDVGQALSAGVGASARQMRATGARPARWRCPWADPPG